MADARKEREGVAEPRNEFQDAVLRCFLFFFLIFFAVFVLAPRG